MNLSEISGSEAQMSGAGETAMALEMCILRNNNLFIQLPHPGGILLLLVISLNHNLNSQHQHPGVWASGQAFGWEWEPITGVSRDAAHTEAESSALPAGNLAPLNYEIVLDQRAIGWR